MSIRSAIGKRSFEDHEGLVKLNELNLSYPSWETDFDETLTYLKDNGRPYVLGKYVLEDRIQGKYELVLHIR